MCLCVCVCVCVCVPVRAHTCLHASGFKKRPFAWMKCNTYTSFYIPAYTHAHTYRTHAFTFETPVPTCALGSTLTGLSTRPPPSRERPDKFAAAVPCSLIAAMPVWTYITPSTCSFHRQVAAAVPCTIIAVKTAARLETSK
jgi:peptidoglycan/LPS O-acetylase OafA/YrhL